MKFNPKAGMLPDGEYDATITEAEEKSSKAGNDMIEIILKVYGPGGVEVNVMDWIMEAVPWKMRHFSSSIGHDFDSGILEAADLIGQSVRVSLSAETSGQFAGRNKVIDYVGPAKVGVKDMDIPF